MAGFEVSAIEMPQLNVMSSRISFLLYGPLAQLAEHLTFNQGVTGSNPVRPTICLLLFC